MKREMNEDMKDIVKKLNEEKEKEIQNIDYCPGCSIAYCQGRYTTGQCE